MLENGLSSFVAQPLRLKDFFFLFDLREVNWCPDHVTKNSKSSSYVTYHIQLFRKKCTQSVQDFLIKLNIKPCMHLVEISIFSSKLCHHLTYQNYDQPPQTSQNPYFQSYFCVFRMVKSFRKKIYEKYFTRRTFFFFWKYWYLRYFIS